MVVFIQFFSASLKSDHWKLPQRQEPQIPQLPFGSGHSAVRTGGKSGINFPALFPDHYAGSGKTSLAKRGGGFFFSFVCMCV